MSEHVTVSSSEGSQCHIHWCPTIRKGKKTETKIQYNYRDD